MGIKSDDEVKQALLDSLAEEPPMVLSTAYVYAKNYVNYGEDITKAWTTAVQQASVIQEVRQKAWVEAYDSFKKDYEARLRADMMAILKEMRAEMEYVEPHDMGEIIILNACKQVVDTRINSLKEQKDGTNEKTSDR